MENKIMEAMSCLDCQLIQEASLPVAAKRRWPRTMVLAACLAVLCTLSVVAKVYTGWQIGEVTRFDAKAELEERGWKESWAPDSFWEEDGKYQLFPQAEHEAYPFDEAVIERFSKGRGDRTLYFDSISEMNTELKLNILDSPLLKEPGEQLWISSCYRGGDNDKFYLLGGQYFDVEGYENLWCSVAFVVWGYSGTDVAFGTSSEKNDYTFSQLEIKKLQVTAECIADEEQGFDIVNVFFTKDGVSYICLFSSKGEVDMAAVTAVLETLE